MRPLFCLLIFSAISGVWFHGDHHPLVFGLRLCDQQGKRDSFFFASHRASNSLLRLDIPFDFEQRLEGERFKKIDAKRGGRGFV